MQRYYRVRMSESRSDVNDTHEGTIALPWWRSPLNVSLLALLLVLAGFVLGTVIPRGDDPAVHNNVDTGFLQDMRIHHEQAIAMSVVYRSIASTGSRLDPMLSTIALEISMDQGMETGRMVQLLRLFGEAETNESSQVMGWMGHAMDLGMMPGLATDEQLNELRNARGKDADTLFGALMISHHEGGIHMAEYAAVHAKNPEVKALAKAMIKAQTGEIAELKKLTGQ